MFAWTILVAGRLGAFARRSSGVVTFSSLANP
jgi:hypothetical protein